MRAYAAAEGLCDPDERADFEDIIAAMDAVYLEHAAERSRAEGRWAKRR